MGARLAVPVFLAAILVPVGLMVYSAVRGGDSLVRTAADAITAAATTGRAAPATLTLTDLDDLSPGYHTLDAAPPSSGYASLDAIGALPWAVTIAQAWVNDARLDRIDVVRVQPDGLVNVADDREAEVTYRFVSPDRIKELRRRADLSANANVQTEFWVRVKGGQASVIAPTTPAALLAFRDHEGDTGRAPQRASARRDIRQACGSSAVQCAILQGLSAAPRRRGLGLVLLDPVRRTVAARSEHRRKDVSIQVES